MDIKQSKTLNGKALPPEWQTAKLEDVVNILDSQRVPVNAKERELRQGKIPYYGATGQVGWIDDCLFDEELVLLGEDGAPFLDPVKPKAYIIRGKSWVNNHAHVLRAKEDVPSAYIKYYLDIVDYHGFVTGTTRLKLNQASMRQIPVPVAPSAQRRLIVAEIEKQFSRLDEAIANLKRAKANLKRYKASVLKAAVEGKLTEQWRKEHPDVEPASKLLERILAERRKRWEGKGNFKEPTPLDNSNLPILPTGWVWATLEQVSELNPGIDKSLISDAMDVSFVPMTEVGADNGYINVKKTRLFSEVKKGFTNFLENDVLFAKITPCMENGKIAVVPALVNGYGFGSTEFHVIRPLNGLNPHFVYYLVSNLSYRKSAAHHMTGAVGQKRVPIDFLRKTLIPIAPIEEQIVIISEAQKRLTVVEKLDEQIEMNMMRAERLRQSILNRAFTGKLLPVSVDIGRVSIALTAESV